MKKVLNILAVLSFCVLVAMAILFFTDSIKIFLWVKYLFLLCSLFILLALYAQFGKRTIFDECIYCLRKALKGHKKLDYNRSDKFMTIKLLNIKNYLAFAIRYMEELEHTFDLYELKNNINNIKELSEHLSTKHIDEIKNNHKSYQQLIIDALDKVSKENEMRKIALEQAKEQKRKELKSKKRPFN